MSTGIHVGRAEFGEHVATAKDGTPILCEEAETVITVYRDEDPVALLRLSHEETLHLANLLVETTKRRT